ncbi:hypothetical protein AB7M16_002024 [Bradyrhizobium sp. USDA 372]
MIVNMCDLGGGPVLSGATTGRMVLAELLKNTAREPPAVTPVLLDFGWVTVATSSFLRESVLAFRDAIRSRRSNFYPVVANVNQDVREELEDLLGRSGGVLMSCVVQDDEVVEAAPIGELDPKQRLTFDLVQQRRETDAGELMRDFAATDPVKSPTAWNNRLANLAMLGLVAEISQGRSKRYKPIFEGV